MFDYDDENKYRLEKELDAAEREIRSLEKQLDRVEQVNWDLRKENEELKTRIQSLEIVLKHAQINEHEH